MIVAPAIHHELENYIRGPKDCPNNFPNDAGLCLDTIYPETVVCHYSLDIKSNKLSTKFVVKHETSHDRTFRRKKIYVFFKMIIVHSIVLNNFLNQMHVFFFLFVKNLQRGVPETLAVQLF